MSSRASKPRHDGPRAFRPSHVVVLPTFLIVFPLAAQSPAPAPPSVQAAWTAGPAPMIDGDLDDTAWAAAPVATGFIQHGPVPGAPASQGTEVRILYDDQALYVGMRMYDAHPDSIQSQVGRRDSALPGSDWAAVALDTRGTGLNAFEFRVTPAGSRRDLLHYGDTRADEGWEAVWEVATAMDAEGWSAEFRIPFSQLRYAVHDETEIGWAANFIREIGRLGEVSYWAPIDPDERRFVSRFGRLDGLERLPSVDRKSVV